MEEVKDLGVIVSQNLKPSKQCAAAAKRASRILGMIYRNIKIRAPRIMSRLIKQLIRPHVEYAVQAWSPWLRRDIELLESVQRRATKMVTWLRDLPYEERLRRLNLTTLEKRRVRGDNIETFKILRGLEELTEEDFFDRPEASQATRGHSLKLRKKHTRLDIRKYFYTCRAVDSFNSIPPSAAQVQTVMEFKKGLQRGERAIARL